MRKAVSKKTQPTNNEPKNTDKQPKNTNGNAAPLLPPDNTIEVKPEGTSGETVNQKRLREFYELQQAFLDLRDRYLATYSKIQDLIISGADIQRGQYKVAYGLRLVRRPRYKQVVIDLKGEAYQQRVLEQTQPHAHFHVRVN